jgi:hypothetical protein
MVSGLGKNGLVVFTSSSLDMAFNDTGRSGLGPAGVGRARARDDTLAVLSFFYKVYIYGFGMLLTLRMERGARRHMPSSAFALLVWVVGWMVFG